MDKANKKTRDKEVPRRSLTRNHLPTPAEIAYFRALIRKGEAKLKKLDHDINMLTSHNFSIRNNGHAPNPDTKTKTSKGPLVSEKDWSSDAEPVAVMSSLLEKRAILESKLSTVRAFVAPIRKIPIIILTEILEYVVTGVPSRSLALVSRAWRYILQSTPSFWRTIELKSIMRCHDPPDVLRRRLALAKFVELDVFLVAHPSPREYQLRQILADIGLDRWRSLNLNISFGCGPGEDSMFKGALSNLHSLTITALTGSHNTSIGWSSLLDLVANTASDLRCFKLINTTCLPQALTRTSVFSELVSLSLHRIADDSSIPLDNIEDLTLQYYDGNPPITLPSITSIRDCNFANLDKCDFRKVTNLTIELQKDPKNQHPTFKMPHLVSLSIKGSDAFTCLLKLHAPKLIDLVLLDTTVPCGEQKVLSDYSNTVTKIFGTNKHQLHIKPTTVKLSLSLKVDAMLLVLRSWDQIEHLELFWNKDFRWNSRFIRAFCQDKTRPKPVCPNLITIRIKMERWEKEELVKWEKATKEILRLRRNAKLPLCKIAWVQWPSWRGEVRSCTVGDVQ